MPTARLACAALAATVIVSWERAASAIDLTDVGGQPLKLEVTETSVLAQHFQARTGESELDQGYAAWLNRLDVALSYGRFTVGVRLDSSVYGNRPEDQPSCPSFWPCLTSANRMAFSNIVVDDTSRYRDAVYPAKL